MYVEWIRKSLLSKSLLFSICRTNDSKHSFCYFNLNKHNHTFFSWQCAIAGSHKHHRLQSSTIFFLFFQISRIQKTKRTMHQFSTATIHIHPTVAIHSFIQQTPKSYGFEDSDAPDFFRMARVPKIKKPMTWPPIATTNTPPLNDMTASITK